MPAASWRCSPVLLPWRSGRWRSTTRQPVARAIPALDLPADVRTLVLVIHGSADADNPLLAEIVAGLATRYRDVPGAAVRFVRWAPESDERLRAAATAQAVGRAARRNAGRDRVPARTAADRPQFRHLHAGRDLQRLPGGQRESRPHHDDAAGSVPDPRLRGLDVRRPRARPVRRLHAGGDQHRRPGARHQPAARPGLQPGCDGAPGPRRRSTAMATTGRCSITGTTCWTSSRRSRAGPTRTSREEKRGSSRSNSGPSSINTGDCTP